MTKNKLGYIFSIVLTVPIVGYFSANLSSWLQDAGLTYIEAQKHITKLTIFCFLIINFTFALYFAETKTFTSISKKFLNYCLTSILAFIIWCILGVLYYILSMAFGGHKFGG